MDRESFIDVVDLAIINIQNEKENFSCHALYNAVDYLKNIYTTTDSDIIRSYHKLIAPEKYIGQVWLEIKDGSYVEQNVQKRIKIRVGWLTKFKTECLKSKEYLTFTPQ